VTVVPEARLAQQVAAEQHADANLMATVCDAGAFPVVQQMDRAYQVDGPPAPVRLPKPLRWAPGATGPAICPGNRCGQLIARDGRTKRKDQGSPALPGVFARSPTAPLGAPCPAECPRLPKAVVPVGLRLPLSCQPGSKCAASQGRIGVDDV